MDYERVVKYNYTRDERVALIEMIAMMKGLSALLLRYEPTLAPFIRRAIHFELQEFIQISVR